MEKDNETPPGLEALASHLGYTFVKKGRSSSTSSSSTGPESKPKETEGTPADGDPKEEDTESSKSKIPRGSQTSFGNIYRNGPDDSWTAKEPKNTTPAEGEDTAGHAVVLRQQKSTDSRKMYEIHSIVVQSPALKVALGEILDGYPGVFCKLDRLVFKAPFAPFVHRWGPLLEYMERDHLDSMKKEHMGLLHEILRKELADTIKAFEDYVANGVVTYEHAWVIFQPDAIVVATSGPGQDIALRLKSGSYVETNDGNVYALRCQRVDWNGKSFGWATEGAQLPEFEGIQPIHELPVFPLAFHPKKNSLKPALIERGKRFAALAGYHYRGYDGPAIERTRDGNVLVQTKGRIVVDTDSFCKQPGQCQVYTVPLNSTAKARRGSYDDDGGYDDYDEHGGQWIPPPFGSNQNTGLSLKKDHVPGSVTLTDDQYMMCTSILRGYSLKAKKWLSFYVDHVQPIKWDDDAFSKLVLPGNQKKLVLALSKTQASTANNFDDMISGKGKGMVLLLSGPPGVGKTLTAEAVSENMHVPLYMMSAGDHGPHPDEVEINLQNILDIVAKWKAILLIDECDVFLEARSIHDMERNKLVSIFLRLLEYYEGTLFLTTNKVSNIDPAFQSRIHVHLQYADLSVKSRRQVWASFVEKLDAKFSPSELDVLSNVVLNGRQIKNLIKTAQLLALEEQKTLCKDHIDLVLSIESGYGEA